MKKVLQFLYFVYSACIFCVLIIASIPLTLLFLLLPNRFKNLAMFWLLKSISNIWFTLTGIIVKNYHRGRVDWSKSYMITPNHQSYIDAAVIYTSIMKPFKSLGKIEIEKVPIYNIIYKAVVITVDRSSMRARALSIRKMKDELEKGTSILIFPEGTFPDEPCQDLLPFQSGAASLAIMQQVPILPVLYLDNARRLHPSRIYKASPGLCRILFLPPLSTEGLTKEHGKTLTSYLELYMKSCFAYAHINKAESIWDYAEDWLEKNSISQLTANA